MPLRAFLYDAEGKDKEISLTKPFAESLNENQLLWVDLDSPTEEELHQVTGLFTLPCDVLDNLMQTTRRPRLDNYGKVFVVNLDVVEWEESKIVATRLDLVVAESYVITVHREPVHLLESFERRVKADTSLGQLYGPALLAIFLDWHLAQYFRTLERLESTVDGLDERALRLRNDQDILEELVALRHLVGAIRRFLTPHREIYAALPRPDFLLFSHKAELSNHFALLHDRLEIAIEAIEKVRDLIVGSFEIYTTQVARRTNDVVKLLTIVTVAIVPINAVAGILGMNFRARWFDTGEVGFGISVFLMLTLSAGIIGAARLRRWI